MGEGEGDDAPRTLLARLREALPRTPGPEVEGALREVEASLRVQEALRRFAERPRLAAAGPLEGGGTRSLDLRATFAALLDALLALTGAERAFALLARGEEVRFLVARHFDGVSEDLSWFQVSRTVIAEALAEGRIVHARDTMESRYRELASILRVGILSVLALPIPGPPGEPPLGVIYLDSRRVSRIIEAREAAQADAFLRCNAPLLAVLTEAERQRPAAAAAEHDDPFASLVGEAPAFREVVRLARLAAASDVAVLIFGETGTGKDLFARGLHGGSRRARRAFSVVNCAALPLPLAESELFGYEAGAFTGAQRRQPGRVRAAAAGTLFLDEVGDLDPAIQAKLLRFLQSGEVQPVGGPPEQVDVRVIAATHHDLAARVRTEQFREDLLHRLDVVSLCVPPLRQRGADLFLLAEHFLARFRVQEERGIEGFTDAAIDALAAYDFPGNVRELENAIHRAVIFCRGALVDAGDLPPVFQGERAVAAPSTPRTKAELLAAKASARERAERTIERRFLEMVLHHARGNVSAAARDTGMNRTHLYRLIARHEIDPARFRPAGAPAEPEGPRE